MNDRPTKRGKEPFCRGCTYKRKGGRCRTFRCSRCKRYVPWCQGGSEDNRCDPCHNLKAKP
jgi:hypothetical protein